MPGFEGICYFCVKEKISCYDEKNEVKQGTPDLKAGIHALLHTKYFYITVSVFVATFIINGIFLATAVHFTRDVFGKVCK